MNNGLLENFQHKLTFLTIYKVVAETLVLCSI